MYLQGLIRGPCQKMVVEKVRSSSNISNSNAKMLSEHLVRKMNPPSLISMEAVH